MPARGFAGSTPRRLPGRAFLLPRRLDSPTGTPSQVWAVLIAPFGGVGKGPEKRRSTDGCATPGGEVLAHQSRGPAESLLAVAERRFVHPLAVHPGVEGRLGTDAALGQALADRVRPDERPERRAGVYDHPTTLGWDRERGPHLLHARLRHPVLLEHVDDGPAAGRPLRLAEPLEIQIGEAALRPVLLEADAGAKEAQRHARPVDEDAVRVLLLIHPPAVLEPGSVALATPGRARSRAW